MQVVEAIAYQKLDQRLAALLVNKGAGGRHPRHASGTGRRARQRARDRAAAVAAFEDRGWVDLGRERTGSWIAARWQDSPVAEAR
jgi:hypothetical protein